MAFLDEEPDGARAIYIGAKHAVRAFGHASARLPLLPVYRFTTAAVPLPEGLKRIYCYHVRKTGGTTLAHAFLALGGEDPRLVERRMKNPPFCTSSGPYRFVYQDLPLLKRGYYFFGYSHKPAELIRLPDDTLTVTILRDPVDRVVSLYRYLADPRPDDGQAFHALAHEREWATSGFEQFLSRVSRSQLLNQLYMFSLSGDVHEAAARILRCDRVMVTQHLDQGLAALAAYLEMPLEMRRVRQSKFEFMPTDGELGRLRELLAPEYELLDQLQAALPAGNLG